jgi:pimeloyl-ACP methyl ester carboxylesterase
MVIQLMSPITPHFLSNNILRWVLLPSAVFVTVNTLAAQSSYGYSHKSQHSVDRRTNLKLNTNCSDVIKLRPQDQSKAICGVLTVPESRKNQNSKLLNLPFVIYQALDAKPAVDPVLMLPGGPGPSSLLSAEVDINLPDNPVRQRRDLIVLNYRGTARTLPFDIDCHTPGYPPVLKPGDSPEILFNSKTYPTRDQAFAASTQCVQDLRTKTDRFDLYTSDVVVEDMEDLRRLLGAKRGFRTWNLYGQSYGTNLAQHYLRNRPEGLRSAILDGPLPINFDYIREPQITQLEVPNQVFLACELSPSCNKAYPTLRSRYVKYVTKLWKNPTIFMGKSWSYETALKLPGFIASDPNSQPKVARFLSLLADGDLDKANRYLPFVEQLPASNEYSPGIVQGFAKSVTCFESDPSHPPKPSIYGAGWPQEFRQFLMYKDASIVDGIRNCQLWQGGKKASTTANWRFVSNIPTLIGVGSFDAATPVVMAKPIAQMLPRSQTVIVTGVGHGLNRGAGAGAAVDCWRSIETKYFDNPLKLVDRSCMPDPKKAVFE